MTWPADTHFSVIALWTALVIWVSVYLTIHLLRSRSDRSAATSQTQTQEAASAPAAPVATPARRQSRRTPRSEPIPAYNAHLELSDQQSRWLFYAVRIGRIRGVFRSWTDCAAQTDGFAGARYQGFNDSEKALQYLDWIRAT